jgi:hypothetical protein
MALINGAIVLVVYGLLACSGCAYRESWDTPTFSMRG